LSLGNSPSIFCFSCPYLRPEGLGNVGVNLEICQVELNRPCCVRVAPLIKYTSGRRVFASALKAKG